MALINEIFQSGIWPEMIACIAAMVTFRPGSKQRSYRLLFILFLLLVIYAEWQGYKMQIKRTVNLDLYDVIRIAQAGFFFFLLSRFNSIKRVRFAAVISFILFIASYIIEKLVWHPPGFKGYTRIILAAEIILLCCLFFRELLKDDSIKSPVSYFPFWIVTGLFIFYFGSLPMFAFYEQVKDIKLKGEIGFYKLVMTCLSVVLYGCWTIAFLLNENKRR